MSMFGNMYQTIQKQEQVRKQKSLVVTEQSEEIRRAILEPVRRYPRKNIIEYGEIDPRDFQNVGPVALDFETRGTDWHLGPDHDGDGFRAVGLGLSSKYKTVYQDLTNLTKHKIRDLLVSLGDLPFIAHNVYFDQGVYYAYTGDYGNFVTCTYGLYHMLSNEGFPGQSWGLKKAQKEMLGWSETNEKKLDAWLVGNGYAKGSGLKKKDLEKGPYFNPKTGNYHKPDKSQMWRAPADILGYYCALDADSCYQLYDSVLLPALDKMPETAAEYHDLFLENVKILIRQQISGITIDRPNLEKYNNSLLEKASGLMTQFYEHDDIKSGIEEYDKKIMDAHLEKEPERYKKRKEPQPPKDKDGMPKKYKKDGTISQSWLNYEHKLAMFKKTPPVQSKNWESWETKRQELEKYSSFNLNSNDQLAWLYHERLGFPVVSTTKTGKPEINKNTYAKLGETGLLLHEHSRVTKEQGYVEACLNHLSPDDRLHPQFRAPGTLTGRLAGSGGLNLQQIPATLGYLRNYRPVSGKIWLDSDVKALEPTVLAEYSKDEGLLEVYGPGKVNDIYLFFGANIPGIGDEFKKRGYTPFDPDPASIKLCKKECKNLRSVCKIVHLAKSYGAGPWKIKQGLDLAGHSLPIEEVERICMTWDKTFAGVKEFEASLVEQWRGNGGWIMNGLGRPVTVYDNYLKDILNRFIQSTGHDVLMKYLSILKDTAAEKDLGFEWLISDFHDQFLVETDLDNAGLLWQTVVEAEDRLNDWLGGDIKIQFDPQWIENFAAAKVEAYQNSSSFERLLTKNGLICPK